MLFFRACPTSHKEDCAIQVFPKANSCEVVKLFSFRYSYFVLVRLAEDKITQCDFCVKQEKIGDKIGEI